LSCMKKLAFEPRKYGQELLIDAVDEAEIDLADDELVLSFYALLFVKAGQGQYQQDLADFPLRSHQVIFIRPGQLNRVAEVALERCHLIVFESGFLDEFFVDQNFIHRFQCFHSLENPPYLELEAATFDKYYELARDIKGEIDQLSPDSPHILRSLIYYLLIKLDQHYAQSYGVRRSHQADARILEFQRQLFAHVRQNLSVTAYAEKLQVSRVHLNQLCRRHYGKTASQVIRAHLLTEIKKALKYSQQDVAEIAYDFHFSAPSNFSRFFKQMTGLSPQEFLKELSK
jgi:AraC family transcriptional regulator, transcriptional activator of pobA